MLKQNTNAPRKRQEGILVSKGRSSHVYPISSFPGWEGMVLTLIVTFGLGNGALDSITKGVFV